MVSDMPRQTPRSEIDTTLPVFGGAGLKRVGARQSSSELVRARQRLDPIGSERRDVVCGVRCAVAPPRHPRAGAPIEFRREPTATDQVDVRVVGETVEEEPRAVRMMMMMMIAAAGFWFCTTRDSRQRKEKSTHSIFDSLTSAERESFLSARTAFVSAAVGCWSVDVCSYDWAAFPKSN